MTPLLKSKPSLALIFLVVFGVSIFLLSRPSLPNLTPETVVVSSLPDFSSYQQVVEKKRAFFEFLYPIVSTENQHILDIREQVLALKEQLQQDKSLELSDYEYQWLLRLAQAYRVEQQVETDILLEKLTARIDIIPPSLILSQAAIESGWGSSRFARQGNNLFGQWCFKKGCGIVPKHRNAGQHHEVAKFDSINASIRAYMKNLNSFTAYKKFRQIRLEQRSKHHKLEVGKLLAGLKQYSEQGQNYITKVTRLIHQNKLERYDP